ncbi:hypothetical protein ABT030_41955 [Streptomyces mirabilis]|uniref:hypothetical protein n=1 Tax=Streptomyces mirabilis TaxID=68239 RepID=UPI0033265C28
MRDAPLHLVPVRSRQAKDFVRTWHRHHPPPAGQIFAVDAADETGTLRAVSMVADAHDQAQRSGHSRPQRHHSRGLPTVTGHTPPLTCSDSPDAEKGTIRSMFSVILIAGRWAAEKHADVIAPDQWTRDMAAEYVADTMQATVSQWAGHNRNRSRFGQPISPGGRAARIDTSAGSSATSSNENGSNRASTPAA